MSTLIALLCVPAWLIRGGSLPGFRWMPRWATLAVTPVVIAAALAIDRPSSAWWQWLALALFVVAFFAAQAGGWGRQMDLGSDDKPDDETGHRIRDLIWESQSSFSRDLVGLYMRMAQFLGAAIAVWFWSPLAIVVPLSLVIAAPLVWVAEHVWIKPTAWFGRAAWVEMTIGAMLSVTTMLACWGIA